jgi:hypothetical protein
MSKEKLTIEVAQIDGIEIDDLDLAEACEDKVFEKLTSDSTSTHHQHASLERRCQPHVRRARLATRVEGKRGRNLSCRQDVQRIK